MKFWRTRGDRTRSIHGQLHRGALQIGFHAHLHSYAAGDQRLVLQPFLVVDLGRK